MGDTTWCDTYDRNLVSFGPVTPKFTRWICVGLLEGKNRAILRIQVLARDMGITKCCAFFPPDAMLAAVAGIL